MTEEGHKSGRDPRLCVTRRDILALQVFMSAKLRRFGDKPVNLSLLSAKRLEFGLWSNWERS
ncbi:hypothetical protein J6590_000644 [Homalodisca vitripennis]|nr:hypothetical protein J6590_000644 [Homalodisca vitripennis]